MVNECQHLHTFVLPLVWGLGGGMILSESECLDCGERNAIFLPYGYYQLECPHGHCESYMAYVDNRFSDDHRTKCSCGEPFYFLRTIDEVEDPGVLINWVEGELENRNYHDQIELIDKFYGKLVQEFGHHLEVARILKEVFVG